MTSFRRTVTAVAVLALSAFAAPAFAGPTETAYLASYAGVWNGSGKLTGEEAGTLKCKMTFKQSTTKLNYTGRCSFSGAGSKSFSGAISYNDSAKRYEASSQGKKVAGTKSGDTIVFNMASSSMQGDVTTAMQFSPNGITFDLNLVDDHGAATQGHVTLAKS